MHFQGQKKKIMSAGLFPDNCIKDMQQILKGKESLFFLNRQRELPITSKNTKNKQYKQRRVKSAVSSSSKNCLEQGHYASTNRKATS